MKTAIELLGSDFDSKAEVISSGGPPLGRPLGQVTYQLTVEQLERFAIRVRDDLGRDDSAMPPPEVIEAMAKGCKSCGECGEAPPCATCMAGGVCLASCRCEELQEERERLAEEDFDPNGCPGCGGNCQVACR